MYPNFPLIILVFGTLQGFFLTVLLSVHQKGIRLANRLLAGLTLVISLQLADACLTVSGGFTRWPHLIFATRPLWFLLAPLLYLYVRQLTKSKPQWSPGDILHLIPALISFTSLCDFYLLSEQEKLAGLLALYRDTNPAPEMLLYWNLYTIQLLAYAFAAHRCLQDAVGVALENSNGQGRQFLWLKRLLQIFALYLVFAFSTILTLTIKGTYLPFIDFLSIFVLTVFIHAIALLAIRCPEQLFPAIDRLKAKYQRSALSVADVRKAASRLSAYMITEQPFLDSSLNLKNLAMRLEISPHHLSQIINQELTANFYDFVNGYRIEEAKRRLRDPGYQMLTIEAIANDTGFKSRASFYRIFKNATGLTPTQFSGRRNP